MDLFYFILICLIICIFAILTSSIYTNIDIEAFLTKNNFNNIKKISNKNVSFYYDFYTAEKSGTLYLFKACDYKYPTEDELKTMNSVSKPLKVDKVVCVLRTFNGTTEDALRMANLYKVELWNYNGKLTSNQVIASTRQTTNINGSRLAKELVQENEKLEHYENGVITQDNCHIEPISSPIQENPTAFSKKRKERL